MKAVDPIPIRSEQQTSDTKKNGDTEAKMNIKKIAQNRKNMGDGEQKTGDPTKNKARINDLPNQDVFGSLVSLNEYIPNTNQDQ